ncbi:MAG: hypothetical protein ACTSP9_18690 [Promethearchaeota archaeon]
MSKHVNIVIVAPFADNPILLKPRAKRLTIGLKSLRKRNFEVMIT